MPRRYLSSCRRISSRLDCWI